MFQILNCVNCEWDSRIPSVTIPKKNGTIRVVTGFRKLNLLLKRHPFSIPQIEIAERIRSIEGFTFNLEPNYLTSLSQPRLPEQQK
jgi:hypothetical protein